MSPLMGRRRPKPPPLRVVPPPSSVSSSPATPSPLPAPPNTPSDAAPGQEHPATSARRQPVLLSRTAPPSRRRRCAEVAGGTAADCAAVCCCCPCGILNLVVLAVVKLPAGLCRRAYLKKKKKKKLSAASAARKRKAGVGAADGSAGTTHRGLLGPYLGDTDDDEDDEEFVVFSTGGPVVVGPGAKGLLLGSAVGWPAESSPSVEVMEMDKEMWAHFYGGGFWRSQSQRDI